MQQPTPSGGLPLRHSRFRALVVPSAVCETGLFLLYQKEGYTRPSTLGRRRPTGRFFTRLQHLFRTVL